MFKSNSKYYIKSTITSTQIDGTTFLLSPDFELWANLETAWASVSLVLKNATQIERMEVTATGWTATIVKRGLTQDFTEAESVGLQKQWTDGTIAVVTAFAFDLVDKQGDTMTGSLKFSWATNEGIVVNSLTTTQRDALVSPDNGAIIYNTTTGEFQVRQWGSWVVLSSWSTQPNASTTVAGKVEIATQGEFDAWTAIGGTGAVLVASPDLQQKQINTSTAKTTMVVTDSFGIADSADSWKIKKVTLGQLLATTDAQSTTSTSGVVERATDAETLTWTDTIRYVTPAQMWKSVNNVVTTMNSTNSNLNSTVTSSSLQMTKNYIAVFTCSLSSAATNPQVKIQWSTDNSSWNDLCSNSQSNSGWAGTDSSTDTITVPLVYNLYYRTQSITNNASNCTASISLTHWVQF